MAARHTPLSGADAPAGITYVGALSLLRAPWPARCFMAPDGDDHGLSAGAAQGSRHCLS
jgi:hypothetical protein